MTIYHSEPYKAGKKIDLEGYPLLIKLTEPPYSDSDSPCNDKEHQVYCQHCCYRTLVKGLMGPRCGTCKNYLITVVKRILPDGAFNPRETETKD